MWYIYNTPAIHNKYIFKFHVLLIIEYNAYVAIFKYGMNLTYCMTHLIMSSVYKIAGRQGIKIIIVVVFYFWSRLYNLYMVHLFLDNEMGRMSLLLCHKFIVWYIQQSSVKLKC